MLDLTQGVACGGSTYQFVYVSGPRMSAVEPMAGYSITQLANGSMQVTGSAADLSWVGRHSLKLKCFNGQTDLSPTARGNSGLFASVFSTVVTLEIADPCVESVVNSDDGLVIGAVSVPLGQTVSNRFYSGPTNSASLEHGNGFDLCGQLAYTLLDS